MLSRETWKLSSRSWVRVGVVRESEHLAYTSIVIVRTNCRISFRERRDRPKAQVLEIDRRRWIVKPTDFGFVYRLVERSGVRLPSFLSRIAVEVVAEVAVEAKRGRKSRSRVSQSTYVALHEVRTHIFFEILMSIHETRLVTPGIVRESTSTHHVLKTHIHVIHRIPIKSFIYSCYFSVISTKAKKYEY